MKSVQIKAKAVREGAILPAYQTNGAACFDFVAAADVEWERVKIGTATGEAFVFTAVVPTGFAFEIPEGYRMDIYPRSGWAFKHNIQLANGTGKIDSDYRGEVMVKLIGFFNEFSKVPEIKKGTRIAQSEINEVTRAEFVLTEDLSDTDRGEGGFGHTGH